MKSRRAERFTRPVARRGRRLGALVGLAGPAPATAAGTLPGRADGTDPSYTGTVALRSSDPGQGAAVDPGTYRLKRADAGTVTFAAPRGVVLVTGGPQTIRAADTRRRVLSGAADVVVTPVRAPASGRTAVGWRMDLFGGLGDGGENEYASVEPRTVLGGAVWVQVSCGRLRLRRDPTTARCGCGARSGVAASWWTRASRSSRGPTTTGPSWTAGTR